MGDAALSGHATTLITGTTPGALWGQTASAGDLNGDGYADLVVGGPGNIPSQSQGGIAMVFGDPSRSLQSRISVAGPQAFDFFGYAVSATSDLDGDGYDDLIVGAPLTDDGLGAAYIFRGGPSPSSTADVVVHGAVASSQFGRSLAWTGDFDGDGAPDTLIGAPAVYSSTAGVFGRAYLYWGAAPQLSGSAVTLSMERIGDYFGGCVGGAAPP